MLWCSYVGLFCLEMIVLWIWKQGCTHTLWRKKQRGTKQKSRRQRERECEIKERESPWVVCGEREKIDKVGFVNGERVGE